MTQRNSILFIDHAVRHSDILVAGLRPDTDIHRLSPEGDALAEIASVLSHSGPVGSLSILAHGAPGAITLGGRRFDRAALQNAEGSLARIRKALAPDADVMLISCSSGQGMAGRAFVAGLEAALGVPVLASESDLGADAGWSGLSRVATLFAPTALASYPARLVVSIGDAGDNLIVGTASDDTLDGAAGNDTIRGNDGNDTITGGDGNDEISAGSGNDSILGGSGDDTISGFGGNDLIYGDAGDDVIGGGNANETIYGGDGNDRLYVQGGNDLLYGGDGNDTISTGDGGDKIYGEGGDDIIILAGNAEVYGGDGNDTISGSIGSDTINGGNGDDSIVGGGSLDFISSGAGNDTILGGASSDNLVAEDGNDVLSGGDGTDNLNGGAGNDTYIGTVAEVDGDTISGLAAGDVIQITGDTSYATSLHATTVGSTLTIGSSTITLSDAGTGLYISGAVSGGNSVLTITSTDPNAVTETTSSGDVFTVSNQSAGDVAGTEINHTLTNGTGAAATGALIENTGSGNVVTVTLPAGMSVTTSGNASAESGVTAGSTLTEKIDLMGSDSFLTGHADTFVNASGGVAIDVRSVSFSGSDGTAQTITFSGQSGGSEGLVIDTSGLASGSTIHLDNIDFAAIVGDGTVTVGSGQTYLVGNSGVQVFTGGSDDDTLAAGGGNDAVVASWGDDLVYGNQGTDSLFGSGGLDTLFGGQDADSIFGGNDADMLYGNKGSDMLTGGEGVDLLYGGQDDDLVYGNTGADSLHGNLGNDTLFGGQGNDLLYGEAGADYLVGNAGDDTISGGDGADTFVFSFGGGNDTVADFQSGTDSLAFESGLGIASSTESDGNTILTLSDGGTVTLIGVAPSALGLAATAGWEF